MSSSSMITAANPSDLAEDFGQRWNRFWFTPADPLPAAILRIIVGLLAAVHFVDCGVGLTQWYAKDGVVSATAVRRLLELTGGDANYHVSYLNNLPASAELWAVHVVAIIAGLAFGFGLLTRLSGILTLVAVLAYVHRVPQVAGHVEPVLAFLTAYLCIAPSGACLSFDRRLLGSGKKQPLAALLIGPSELSMTANIGLRLIQVHLAMFYAMMGLSKLYGDAWWEGGAIWILLAQTESRPMDLTGMRRAGQVGLYLLNFWTHAVIYFELAFGVLIWSRLVRPILLVLSIAIWLSIIVATGQLLFGLTMLAAGIAYVPADHLRSLAGRRNAAVIASRAGVDTV